MHPPRLALALLAPTAAVATVPQPIANWVVSNVTRRIGSYDVCDWTMWIDNGELPDDAPLFCQFQVSGSVNQTCDVVQFINKPCPGSSFTIGGGHSDQGFMVVTVHDHSLHGIAVYGFSDEELNYGWLTVPQNQSAYNETRFGPPAVKARDVPASASLSSASPTLTYSVAPVPVSSSPASPAPASPAVSWTIKDLIRVVDREGKIVIVDFTIVEDTVPVVHCVVALHPLEKDVALESWTWAWQKCQESDFFVSWGYTPLDDAGIMTVISPSRRMNAYFGYRNINQTERLGDAGPNPVFEY